MQKNIYYLSTTKLIYYLAKQNDKKVYKGDPKTLTPGPWTSPTDWVHGPPHGPVHGPPIRTTPTDPLKKFNRKIKK